MSHPLRRVDAKEAASLMKNGALMVDIREPDEFATAHISGSRNVALSGFARAELGAGPGQAIVFFCASGNRTNTYAAQLASKAAGAPAYVLEGGLMAWGAAGLPTVAGDGERAGAGGGRPFWRR